MDGLFYDVGIAFHQQSGSLLASTLSPIPPPSQPDRTGKIYGATNAHLVERDIRSYLRRIESTEVRLSAKELQGWTEVYAALWKSLGEINAAQVAYEVNPRNTPEWARIYATWKELTNALIRGFTNHEFPGYATPCLYVVGRYLRIFAIKADQLANSSAPAPAQVTLGEDLFEDSSKHVKLEDAARATNRIFQICQVDRAALDESRKWGVYYIASLLFKTYFKLESISLSKNIVSAIAAAATDMPELLEYPTSHVVPYSFYVGVIHFLEEDYEAAEEHLMQAWRLCWNRARRNLVLILTYLIPCRLITANKLPTTRLLNSYSELRRLFGPLCKAVKSASLASFDHEMEKAGPILVKRRIYLTLERSRILVYRNLFRKMYQIRTELVSTGESTETVGIPASRKVPIAAFGAAIKLSEKSKNRLEQEEVESLIANLVANGLMKGYISREHRMVVLNKDGVFPGTGI